MPPPAPHSAAAGPTTLGSDAAAVGGSAAHPLTLDDAPPVHAAGQSLRQRTVRSGAWQLGAYGVQNAVRFGSNVVLTRLVTPELFGLSAVVTVVLMGLEMFSDVGVGPNIVQNKHGEREPFLRTAFTVQALRGCLLFLIGCAVAYPVSLYTERPVHLWLIPVGAAVALFDGFRSTAWYRLQRRVQLHKISMLQTGMSLLGVSTMIAWAWAAPSVWALIVPMVAVAGAQTVLSHLVFLRDRRDAFGWDRGAARDLFGFGGWVFASSALTFLANSADRLLFAGMVPMETLGIYNIAFVMATMPVQALVRLGATVIFPAYAAVRDDPARLADVFARVRGPLTLLGGFAAAGLIGAGRPLVDVVYPPEYRDAGWMLQLLAVAGWLQILQTSNDAALLATGRPKWVALGHLCKAVALVAGILLGWRVPVWLGLPGNPFAGAVAGVAAAELARYLVSGHMMHRLGLHVLRRDLPMTAYVVASASAGWAVTYFLFANEWLDLLASATLITLLWLPALRIVARRLRARGAPSPA